MEAWKHSQYFFRQPLFLQLQPLLWRAAGPVASAAALSSPPCARPCLELTAPCCLSPVISGIESTMLIHQHCNASCGLATLHTSTHQAPATFRLCSHGWRQARHQHTSGKAVIARQAGHHHSKVCCAWACGLRSGCWASHQPQRDKIFLQCSGTLQRRSHDNSVALSCATARLASAAGPFWRHWPFVV